MYIIYAFVRRIIPICNMLNCIYSIVKFLLRVVRDVDKAEHGFAVAFIIVQSSAEELRMDILERG